MSPCPVCKLPDQEVFSANSRSDFVKCERCGNFLIASELRDDLQGWVDRQPLAREILSQLIRISKRAVNHNSRPFTNYDLENAIKQFVPATVDEQASNLLLHLAERSTEAGKAAILSLEEIQSEIRALSPEGVAFLLHGLKDGKLLTWQSGASINGSRPKKSETIQLTFDGWSRAGELKRANLNSKTAFMAMKFGDANLDRLFETCLVSSVGATGFRLERVIDQPKAGLIDARMVLMIKNSRFLIADLTHGNNGAYWEAGFAEGLGRPVIYICHSSKRQEKAISHFDTNHRQTLFWDSVSPSIFADELKAIIRLTVPEAMQVDA